DRRARMLGPRAAFSPPRVGWRLSPGRRGEPAVRTRAGTDHGRAQAAGATDRGTDRPLARALGADYPRHRERVSGVRSGRGGADQRSARGLMACGSRLPERHERLRDAIVDYIGDEHGHERWILADLRALGIDAEARVAKGPSRATELMVSY